MSTSLEGTRPRVSIVLATYNEAARIDTFGRTVTNQRVSPGTELSLFVSDNGSNDATREKAGQYGTVVTGSLPRNCGSARRVGAEAAIDAYGAGSDHILVFTDADAKLPQHYAETVANAFADDPSTSATYGPAFYEFSHNLTVPAPGKVLDILRGRILHNLFKFHDRDVHDYVKPPFSFLPGWNTAVRADSYVAAGGHTDFGSGADDLELSLRLKDTLPGDAIRYVRRQRVTISGRSYESENGVPSLQRVLTGVRGKHTPFKSGETSGLSHSEVVVGEHIRKTDRRRYSLDESEYVAGIYDVSKIPTALASARRVQAKNYHGMPIPQKVAIIAA